MKLSIFILLLSSSFLLFLPAALAASQEIAVTNASEAELYDLFIVPAGSAERGPNALNGKELLNGKRLQIVFANFEAGDTKWDIVGINCCGEKLRWQQLDLNSIRSITLRDGGIVEFN